MHSEPRKVTFLTKDHLTIHANYWKAESSRAVILVHQFNSSKESYNDIAKLLNENGYGVLAIDLRGHGESRSQGSLANPTYLSDKDFQNMRLDLAAAQKFLSEKGYADFFLVGSSIGANLAIIYPFESSGFKAAVALSPGEDFKSLNPLQAAQETGIATMIVASKDDAYSFESAKKIAQAMSAEKKLVELENAGHGTSMLQNNSTLSKQILEWFKEHD